MTTYHAAWLLRSDDEPVRDGVLVVENGRVVEAGPWKRQSIDVEFGEALIIPGFVNAHTHLDLGALRLPKPPSFTAWLEQVVNYRRDEDIREWDAAIIDGINESIRQGTTALGDISANGSSWMFLEPFNVRFV